MFRYTFSASRKKIVIELVNVNFFLSYFKGPFSTTAKELVFSGCVLKICHPEME